jgi:hypothetical protein
MPSAQHSYITIHTAYVMLHKLLKLKDTTVHNSLNCLSFMWEQCLINEQEISYWKVTITNTGAEI